MLPLDYLLFLQIIIFLFITPGTPRMLIISYSINYGVQKCIWTALGDISANFIQAILVIFFIETFFSDYPKFLNTIKWVGVTYLLYLAYDIYTSVPKNLIKKNIKIKSFFSFFRDGFLVAGTSPKAWMFFPFIFPQFIDFNQNFIIQFMILIFTYIILDFLSLVGYAMLAQKLIIWLKTNPKVINKISTAVLIFIAFLISISNNY
jgi:threonine/homoserine/homoserine lactone efflux protein